jgi:uncharacterized protein involved in exopolysaccharide biosynthesis
MTTTNPPESTVRRNGILGRLTRRWWRILLVWLVVSIALVCLIGHLIPPTFEAGSILSVEPVHGLYGGSKPEEIASHLSYMQTQIALITTDRVLYVALAGPEIKNLSIIREPADAMAELRKKFVVEIVPGAELIRVAIALPDAKEAAAIVNSVVDSYLAYNGESMRGANSKLRKALVAQRA